MNIFEQRRLFIGVIVGLVVLNIIGFSVVFWRGMKWPPSHGYRNVSSVLKQKLNLSPQQTTQFEQIRAEFGQHEVSITDLIRHQRDSMNIEMFNKTTNDSLVIALSKRIAQNEYKMELLRLEQSKRLKAICTPEQLDKFGQLVMEIRDYFHPDNPNNLK